ncbi:hypothetical protein SAMN02927924_00108 [Sphingobium faniae]|nr:hypothetical protein SAMN02927924_00108 [Sphingobium faniae]
MKERGTRRLAVWVAFGMALLAGFACLHHRHVLGEQQLMLLLFLLLPVGAFLLSGAGQDRSEGEERRRADRRIG